MKYYGKAQAAAESIVKAFEAGTVPAALAPLFVKRHDSLPSRKWSWHNQLLCALAGMSDARGFRQWEAVGRHVKKGQKAPSYILVPLTRKVARKDAAGEESEGSALYGFTTSAVFDVGQTEGAELPDAHDAQTAAALAALPFRSVAESWGLSLVTYSGSAGAPLGKFSRTGAIGLGVTNAATWAHELIHAADDRLGSLVERGQHWRSEVVAELGGATLLLAVGAELDADLGGAYRYVKAYAEAAGLDAVTACNRVLLRACKAVALILDTAAGLDAAAESQAAEAAAESEPVAASSSRDGLAFSFMGSIAV